MSFDLSALKFNVDTERLEVAIKMVDSLATSIGQLKTPLKQMGDAAKASGDAVEKGANVSTEASKKQTKQVDVMSQSVKAFYKEQEKLAKEDQKRQEQMLSAGASMNDQAVKAYEKYLDQQYKSLQTSNAKKLKEVEKAAKDELTVLEKLKAQVKYVSQGSSRGEASALARAEFSGQGVDIPDIKQQQRTVRKLIGGDPFDKSSSGLNSMNQELGQAREGYRQMIKYQEEFNRLQKEGNGEELRLVGLNRKETDNLYRDKQRMIEQYKLLKSSQFDASDTVMIEKQKNGYRDLVANVKTLETTYRQVATAKRPLDDMRTVDSTKKRDKLNYLARATSVQLGDIGVSLAGGQNPLTVFLQQADQMRAIFGDIGREGHNMEKVLNSAFTQIVTGFRDVALKLGEFVLIAFKNTTVAMASMAMSATGVKAAINELGAVFDFVAYKMGMTSKASTELATKVKEMFTAFLTPIVATGVAALIVGLVALAVAYKNILSTSHELNNALIMNGAALSITKKEALDMSAAMATGAATSMDVAKVITEVAKAGNIGKEALLGVTTSAIDMNRYLGMSTKDVVTAYSKLADDPVKALSEIGLATGRVNASTIERINGLIEEGDKTQAVAEANKELTRVFSEMSKKAHDDMTPLAKLWDDMKFSINTLIEGVYKFAQSDGAIKTLTTVWGTLATMVNMVVYAMSTALTLSKAINGIKMGEDGVMGKNDAEMAQNLADFRKTQQGISNPEVAQAQARAEAAKKAAEQEKIYVDVVKNGIATRREATKAELDGFLVERNAIKARMNAEERQKKFGANSKLAAAERAKQMATQIALNNEDALDMGKGTGAKLLEIEKKRADIEHSIREGFKTKPEKGAASAIKDEINSRQQAIDNARKESERNSKMGSDKISSEHKRALLNDEDYINQKAAIEEKALNNSIGFFEQEILVAKKKVNSLKEVQTLEGKISKAKSDIQDKQLEKGYALLELQRKQDMESINNNANLIEEVDKKNLALKEQLETEMFALSLIGQTADAIQKLEDAKIKEQATDARGQAARLAELDPARSRLLLEQAEAYEKIAKAKEMAYQKTFMNKFVGEPVDPKAPQSFGPATTAVSKDVSQGRSILESMEAEKKLIADKMASATASDAVREADQKRFDELSANITSLQGRLNLTLTLSGLEDIASQMQGFAGGFTSAAQANLAEVTKKVSLMGSAYRASGKEILKHAQDQANAAARQQKAIGNIGSAIKNYGEIEKKNYNSTSEKMNAQIGGYAELAGAAKSYFEEGSAGYEVLAAAEQAFRAIQLAMSIAAMVQSKTETGSMIVDSLAKTGAYIVEAATKFFAQSGWGGFVGVAAMLAVVAGLGGAFGSGGGGGGASGGISASGSYVGTGSEVTATGQIRGTRNIAGGGGGESPSSQTDYETAMAAQDAAEANEKYLDSLRSVNEGMTQLETDLANVKIATQGTGRAQHELATQGMSESEIATYNYNASLRGQIMVLMDAANGTENASENMRDLANESVKLAIDLKRAQGDIAGANYDQMKLDTVGYTEAEIAVYDHNQAKKAEIEALEAGASAAREAAQAEIDLANTRAEIAGRLNILLLRTTQTEVDRVAELAGTTDEASIGMLKLIYQLEDMNTAIDNSYAKLERSIAAERKLAETRLNAATEVQNLLKTAKDTSTTPLTRGQAQTQLKMLLALVKSSGAMPSADALKPTLTALSKPSEELFGSFVDYQRDFLKTAYNIGEMADLADKQVSMEQATIDRLDAQLETAKQQLNAIKGVDESVKDVGGAVVDFNVALMALTNTIAGAPIFTYSPPAASSGGGGGGGGSGSGSGSTAPTYDSVTEMTNRDIVNAYRAYYNRNPDEGGYKTYLDSHLTGDKLSQAILGGSAGNKESTDYKIAVAKGYNPENPLAKWYKFVNDTIGSGGGSGSSSGGGDYGFAVGINEVPFDMKANIHKGERILPAADNRELMARLQDPQDNAYVLSQAVERLTKEVEGLRSEARQTAVNTGDTSKMLKRLGGEEDILTVRLEE